MIARSIGMSRQSPANDHGNGGVQEGCLNGSAKDVRQSHVGTIVPCFVDGCEVFCDFLDEWDEDETWRMI